MTTSNQKYTVRKYTVVKDQQLYKYNRGKVEEIGEMIQVSEFKDKLRFYTGDKDIWTVFPDSYDRKWNQGHLIEKTISKEPNRKQPPQFGDVGCFSACRCPDSNMFVVVDYDELNDVIYAIFPYLTVKDASDENFKQVQINFGTIPAIGCGISYDKFIPCVDTDEFKIYKFSYQRDSHGYFHSYLSIDALSTFYDYEPSWS